MLEARDLDCAVLSLGLFGVSLGLLNLLLQHLLLLLGRIFLNGPLDFLLRLFPLSLAAFLRPRGGI